MPEFSSARAIEQVCWQFRLSDYPRSRDRALINRLANGAPPYYEDEARDNGSQINTNDLSLTRLAHDGRSQLFQSLSKPDSFFAAKTDGGTQAKRQERGVTVTAECARLMKRSGYYYECLRSKIAGSILHGIGPSNWQDTDHWCPIEIGIEDVMMPSRTLLTFRNLPLFALWRGYTANELRRFTRHADRNPGWNLDVVNRAIKWADEQTAKLYGGTTWMEYWSPEKYEERFKEDSGIYASDLVPTIDCWDFYYWSDEGKKEGWRRRIVFDAYGGYNQWMAPGGYGERNELPDKNLLGEKGMFLYDSSDRVVADRLDQLMHFQFADLSAVAPFRYHSVRSLGFLLYAACHLQNRLRCAFSEAVFENLMMYMRVKSLDEAERALKIELANRGIIDESVQFLSPQERWQPNAQFAELGLNEYRQIIADNSSSYTQNQNFSRDRVEKTKFQVMAEVSAMQTLVSAALQQAYHYQEGEYREIFRRFLRKDSTDPDVREFRARCLARNVPEKLLVLEAWDVVPERILGGGNKTMEMAIAQQLMEWRGAYGPEAQQRILRKATLSITDDAAEANALVPSTPPVTHSQFAAMAIFGTLMKGGLADFPDTMNRLDLARTLTAELVLATRRGARTPEDVAGLQNVLQTAGKLVAEVAADDANADAAKAMQATLAKAEQAIKGFAQDVAKAAAEAGANGNGADAELAAKLKATVITAQAKAANTRESHAQRTAQRQVQFELEQERKKREHTQDLAQQAQQHALDLAAEEAKLQLEIERERQKPAPAPAAAE